ncbi:CCA tRNA nucleotidyltransferase [Mammaliicoccus sp. Dog046]|uniref:CCA tRNA nucleotidyltransferase n=1 Tax=Mammaliicoccus sp. Dog046 TaxID=3034233 RepID=UPI002B258943|nr:CCA tRNA nucleotidyltransferase [Mammaliicoccus sp. Dog046]WQK84331.1 CCA tRNA nucleotidyltransferase [Mammaliicoccus sp. Dog046]
MCENQHFETSMWVIDQLVNHGHEAYFVGGSVRDYLMKKSISDVDITTNALPEEVEKIFDRTLPIGKEHGTIIVLGNDEQFEVTTFRKDGDYVDHRRPTSVQFVTELYEDLARRDFTMNAIAMDSAYQLHDYFKGYEDIKNQIIRAVGTPLDRMEEDALRIMRGVRFQSQTGFAIEDETEDAMKQTAYLLDKIAIERIIVELKKLVTGANIEKSMATTTQLSLFQYIPFFNKLDQSTIFIPKGFDFEIWIATLCFINEVDSTQLSAMKLSNQEKRNINEYIQLFKIFKFEPLTKEHLTVIIYTFGALKVKTIMAFIQQYENNLHIQYQPIIMNPILVNEIYDKLPIYHNSELNLNGQILMSTFQKNGGPWIKDILNKLERAVILRKVNNTQDDLIEWVQKNV